MSRSALESLSLLQESRRVSLYSVYFLKFSSIVVASWIFLAIVVALCRRNPIADVTRSGFW